jgi:hypothetical protein
MAMDYNEFAKTMTRLGVYEVAENAGNPESSKSEVKRRCSRIRQQSSTSVLNFEL